jgi:cysteine synthase A
MDRNTTITIATAGAILGVGATLAAQHLLSSPTTASKSSKNSKIKTEDEVELKEDIRNGLEECIGDTPLILLKSLSAATGCEILGKAEV